MNQTTTKPDTSRTLRVLERVCHPVRDHVEAGTGQRFIIDEVNRTQTPVSKGYALVQNNDIITPFIHRFGVESVRRLTQYGLGKFTHLSLETGREFAFSYNGQSDVIRERLIVENSYNKTRSFRFMFGAFRTVCANGLYTGHAFAAIRRVHSGNINASEIVAGVLEQYERMNGEGKDSFDLWRDFQAAPMTEAEEIQLVKEFKPFDEGTADEPNQHSIRTNRYIQARAERRIQSPEGLDNQRNAWGLFNQLNWAIARQLNTPSALPRLISANVSAEAFVKKAVAR